MSASAVVVTSRTNCPFRSSAAYIVTSAVRASLLRSWTRAPLCLVPLAVLLHVWFFVSPAMAGPECLRLTSGPVLVNPDGVYKGIPYAAPPVGPLRWKPPQPAATWTEPRRFDSFGPACPQPDSDDPCAEDCLTLNVWTPAKNRTEKLPVMVFLHGGSFLTGSGSVEVYDGQTLADSGVVLVTFNYRLGALGFLAHPALSSESPEGVSGNYGLLDQQAALSWVRRNITAFGGDSARVTVFGQSAGASAVVIHLVSPGAGALFDRAIAQSPVGPGAMRTLKQDENGVKSAEAVGEAFAKHLLNGKTPDPPLANLRAASPEALVAATRTFDKYPLEVAGIAFGPTVDSVMLPGRPTDLIRQGRQHKVPLVIGSTTDEASLFLPGLRPPVTTSGAYRRLVEKRFGVSAVQVLGLLPGKPARLQADLSRLLTVFWFEAYIRFLARQWADSGTPCWLYIFSRPLPEGALDLLADEGNADGVTPEMAGVPHSADLFPVFGFTPWYLGFDSQYRTFARSIRIYWTDFARTGRPDPSGHPQWPSFSERGPRLMEFGRTIAPRPLSDDPLVPLVEESWNFYLY